MSTPNRGAKIALAMNLLALVYPGAYVAGILHAVDDSQSAAVNEWRFLVAGAAASLFLCGILSKQIEARYVLGMIGIHLGLLLPLIWAGAFLFAGLANDELPPSLATPFVIAGAASVLGFVAILALRPKKSERS